MRRYVNGEYVEMTAGEIAELEQQEPYIPPPTAEERLDALEAAIMRGVELGYER